MNKLKMNVDPTNLQQQRLVVYACKETVGGLTLIMDFEVGCCVSGFGWGACS
jgi:hypothetical protein